MTTVFETTLRDRVQVKNIPNSHFDDDRFSFGDYFDMESFKESYTGNVTNEEVWLDWAFEPYEVYFGSIPEISWTREEGDMTFFDVNVEIPRSEERQRLLAHVVADAWEQRTQR